VLVALALWLSAIVARGPTDFDDAYMFVRYADHLRAGHGLRWNLGEAPVFGATSLPHVLVVAALRTLLPGLGEGQLLSLASTTAALAALIVVGLAVSRSSPQRWLRGHFFRASAVLVPALTFSDAFVFHAWSGMDTMLSLLANALLGLVVVQLVERPTPALAVRAAAAAYGAYLVRPDNALLALVPGLALVLLVPRPRLLVWFVAPLALMVGLDLVAKRLLLGSALPLSFYAKWPGAYRGYTGAATWNSFLFLRVFLLTALPFIALLLLLARRRGWRELVVFLLPVALTFAALFLVTPIMGHLGRFFFPALPFVVLAAARLPLERPPQLGPRVAVALGTVLLANAGLLAAGAQYQRSREAAATVIPAVVLPAAATPLEPLDSWAAAEALGQLARAAPAGTRFAMSEHGLPGARAPEAVIIDVLGLHDPAFARGFELATLWRRDPDVIWLPHPDHSGMLAEITGSEQLWRRYDVYPTAFFYGVAVRKDDAALARLFALQWARTYPGVARAEHQAQPARRF
jgi:hypothetical protein